MVVKEGTGVTITMQVMSYPPPDHVQWYMNGSLVTSSALYLISNISVANESTNPITYSASLTISSVNLTTIGFYSASFYGYVGVANNSAIFVTPPGTINHPPFYLPSSFVPLFPSPGTHNRPQCPSMSGGWQECAISLRSVRISHPNCPFLQKWLFHTL